MKGSGFQRSLFPVSFECIQSHEVTIFDYS